MRKVLVTGASKGLGLAIAKMFLDNNDFVFINYHTTKEENLASIYKDYSNCYFIKCDVSKEIEVKRMFQEIKKVAGSLDIVINNAGIAKDSLIVDKTEEIFNEVLSVNLTGTFLVCKYAKELMDKGSIINISSTNGIDTNYPYSVDYDAAKAGVISLTKNFAEAYSPNIRVNTVAPGWINTDMNKEMTEDFKIEECQKILLERFAEPKEIAEVVFFLVSDKASYINGSVIRVDGGLR